jgi:hypothetical protein
VAQWERSCLTGEVPEYYRRKWETASRRLKASGGGYKAGSPWSLTGNGSRRNGNDAGSTEPAKTAKGPTRADGTRKKGDATSGKDRQTEKTAPKEKEYTAGLIGLYHKGRGFNELKLILTDYDVNFEFADQSPDAILGEDRFSIRWMGYVRIDRAGTYKFHTLSDDGVRLWIAGRPVVNNWGDHAATWNSGDIYLKEGYHPIRLDFYENGGVATIKLYWSSERFGREIVPPAHLYHDPNLERKLRRELH